MHYWRSVHAAEERRPVLLRAWQRPEDEVLREPAARAAEDQPGPAALRQHEDREGAADRVPEGGEGEPAGLLHRWLYTKD